MEQEIVYEKLPTDIAERYVLLMDPILGTGGSASRAVNVLLEKGVQESKIFFLRWEASHGQRGPPVLACGRARAPQGAGQPTLAARLPRAASLRRPRASTRCAASSRA